MTKECREQGKEPEIVGGEGLFLGERVFVVGVEFLEGGRIAVLGEFLEGVSGGRGFCSDRGV